MAKSVKLQIKLPSQAELTKQLNELIGKTKDTKIPLDIDTKAFTKSVGEMSKELQKLKTQLGNFNILENINNTSGIEKAKKEVSSLQAELSKLSNYKILDQGSTKINGNMTSEFVKIQDSLGNIITLTSNAQGIIEKTVEPIEKQRQAYEKLENRISQMQSKLNNSSSFRNFANIDTSVVDALQSKLNSINTNTSEKEIKELESAIKNLESSNSQVVKLQSTITKMGIALDGMKGKYGNLVGDSSSKAQLDAYNKSIQTMNSLLKEVLSGKNIDKNVLKTAFDNGTIASKNLNTAVKNSSSALKLAQKDAVTFSTALSSAFTKVGLFSVAYTAINKLKTEIRQGIEAVKDMDSAITTLKITMDGMTNTGLQSMVKQSQELATTLSSTTSKVLEAVTTFANAGETVQSIMNKTGSAIILSNLTGLDTSTTVDTIQSATRQFDELADGTEESAMKITDSMVAISKSLGVDFSKGISEMSDSISILGSLSSQLGGDLDDTLALISAGMEKMRVSGSEMATSLKTIMVRTQRISGEGITEDQFKNAEKALNDIGIKIRNLETGEMQPFMVTLEQIANKWDTMSESAQMALGEELGGVRQLSQVLGTIKNLDRIKELADIGKNSDGAGLEAQAIWAESLDAKLQALTNSSQIFWQNFFNSDSLKGAITGLTNVISALDSVQNKFGSLPLTVGLLTTAFLTFTNNPLKSFVTGVVKGGDSVTNFQKTLSTTMTQMKATQGVASKASVGIKGLGTAFNTAGVQAMFTTAKIAILQTTLSMGLGLAIGSVISLLSKATSKLSDYGQELQDINTAYADSSNGVGDFDYLLSRYEQLESKLKTLNTSTEEYKSVEKELDAVQNTLIGTYSSKISMIEGDTEAKKINLEKTKELNKEEQLLAMANAKESLKSNRVSNIEDIDKTINKYKEYYKLLEEYNDKEDTTVLGNLGEAMNMDTSFLETLKSGGDLLPILKENAQETTDQLEALYEATGVMASEDEKWASAHEKLGDVLGKVREEIDSTDTGALEDGLNGIANSADEASNSLKDLSDSFSGLQDGIELLQTMRDEFSEHGIISTSSMEKVLSSGDSQLIALLGDEANFIDNINKLLDEKSTAQDQALQSAIATAQAEVNGSQEVIDATNAEIDAVNNLEQAKTSTAQNSANQRSNVESQVVNNNARHYALDEANYANKENYKIKGSFTSANQRMDAEKQVVDNNGKNYSVDSTNQANSESAKIKNADGFANASIQGVASMVTNNSKNYQTDSSNFASATNSKLANIRALNDAVGASSSLLNEFKQLTADTSKEVADGFNFLDSTNKYNSVYKKPSISNVSSSYVGSGGIGGSVGHGSLGGSSGSGGSGSSEKEIENIEIATDRYYDLENAIEKVNNALDINNILSKNATDDKKLDYIKEEIKLYNQKREALEKLQAEQKKELAELQKSLSSNGFSFDGDGNVSNLNNRLKQLESWANSGDKENRQATVKNIQEILEAYESLRDTISDTNSDILDINNSIIDAQKDISSIIKDQYEEWKEIEEKKTSKLKEEIQKRKDLMNKEWETEDYEDELDSEQKVLDNLMSQRQDALRTGDKELIASLDKQIAEQQKAISDLIRDQERDNANDKFDEVMDNLDKELETKLEAMDKEMLDDVLLGKIQGGATSLSDIFGNINMASNDLNKNMLMVGDSISSWSDGLSNFIADLSSLSSTQIPLSINGSIQGAIGSLSASNPISISTVINLKGGTVISESEFETAIDNNNKYIFKEINNIFKR